MIKFRKFPTCYALANIISPSLLKAHTIRDSQEFWGPAFDLNDWLTTLYPRRFTHHNYSRSSFV